MIYKFIILVFFFLIVNGCRNTKSDNDILLNSQNILIIVPHPDDETLLFGGIIYDAVKQHKNINIVIITNGDGYFDAAYFWKYGVPPIDTIDAATALTKEEMETYGQTRMQETIQALQTLGLTKEHVTFLGYPDGCLQSIRDSVNIVLTGNTTRSKSFTNKQFTFASLQSDLIDILSKNNNSILFTAHLQDFHPDHAALAKTLKQILAQNKQLKIKAYSGIVNEIMGVGVDNWPLPVCSWQLNEKTLLRNREKRYMPTMPLTMKPFSSDKIYTYQIAKELLDTLQGTPLLRKAIECYKTQTGMILLNGTTPQR